MDPTIKKKVKQLNCIIAILTFASTVIVFTAIVFALLLIAHIIFK